MWLDYFKDEEHVINYIHQVIRKKYETECIISHKKPDYKILKYMDDVAIFLYHQKWIESGNKIIQTFQLYMWSLHNDLKADSDIEFFRRFTDYL